MKRGTRLQSQAKGNAHYLGSLLRNFDLFGEPVALKYKGRSESKSILGGLTTILYVSGIIFYFIILLTTNKYAIHSYQMPMDTATASKVFSDAFEFSIVLNSNNKLINKTTVDQNFTYSFYRLINGVKQEI